MRDCAQAIDWLDWQFAPLLRSLFDFLDHHPEFVNEFAAACVADGDDESPRSTTGQEPVRLLVRQKLRDSYTDTFAEIMYLRRYKLFTTEQRAVGILLGRDSDIIPSAGSSAYERRPLKRAAASRLPSVVSIIYAEDVSGLNVVHPPGPLFPNDCRHTARRRPSSARASFQNNDDDVSGDTSGEEDDDTRMALDLSGPYVLDDACLSRVPASPPPPAYWLCPPSSAVVHDARTDHGRLPSDAKSAATRTPTYCPRSEHCAIPRGVVHAVRTDIRRLGRGERTDGMKRLVHTLAVLLDSLVVGDDSDPDDSSALPSASGGAAPPQAKRARHGHPSGPARPNTVTTTPTGGAIATLPRGGATLPPAGGAKGGVGKAAYSVSYAAAPPLADLCQQLRVNALDALLSSTATLSAFLQHTIATTRCEAFVPPTRPHLVEFIINALEPPPSHHIAREAAAYAARTQRVAAASGVAVVDLRPDTSATARGHGATGAGTSTGGLSGAAAMAAAAAAAAAAATAAAAAAAAARAEAAPRGGDARESKPPRGTAGAAGGDASGAGKGARRGKGRNQTAGASGAATGGFPADSAEALAAEAAAAAAAAAAARNAYLAELWKKDPEAFKATRPPIDETTTLNALLNWYWVDELRTWLQERGAKSSGVAHVLARRVMQIAKTGVVPAALLVKAAPRARRAPPKRGAAAGDGADAAADGADDADGDAGEGVGECDGDGEDDDGDAPASPAQQTLPPTSARRAPPVAPLAAPAARGVSLAAGIHGAAGMESESAHSAVPQPAAPSAPPAPSAPSVPAEPSPPAAPACDDDDEGLEVVDLDEEDE